MSNYLSFSSFFFIESIPAIESPKLVNIGVTDSTPVFGLLVFVVFTILRPPTS